MIQFLKFSDSDRHQLLSSPHQFAHRCNFWTTSGYKLQDLVFPELVEPPVHQPRFLILHQLQQLALKLQLALVLLLQLALAPLLQLASVLLLLLALALQLVPLESDLIEGKVFA